AERRRRGGGGRVGRLARCVERRAAAGRAVRGAHVDRLDHGVFGHRHRSMCTTGKGRDRPRGHNQNNPARALPPIPHCPSPFRRWGKIHAFFLIKCELVHTWSKIAGGIFHPSTSYPRWKVRKSLKP